MPAVKKLRCEAWGSLWSSLWLWWLSGKWTCFTVSTTVSQQAGSATYLIVCGPWCISCSRFNSPLVWRAKYFTYSLVPTGGIECNLSSRYEWWIWSSLWWWLWTSWMSCFDPDSGPIWKNSNGFRWRLCSSILIRINFY